MGIIYRCVPIEGTPEPRVLRNFGTPPGTPEFRDLGTSELRHRIIASSAFSATSSTAADPTVK